VTPAPSEKRKIARTPFCSQVLFWESAAEICLARYFYGAALAAGRIAAPVGEGSAITSQVVGRRILYAICKRPHTSARLTSRIANH
jgi:hypothetical protein